MIDFGLIFARFLHYASTTTLAGATIFPFYAYASTEPELLTRSRAKLLMWAAVVALLSGLAWFGLTVANMSGDVASVADPEVIMMVLRDTSFGIIWTIRMIIATAIVGVTMKQVSSRRPIAHNLLMTVLAASLLASLAGAGHARVEQGFVGFLHVICDVAHLLAAGAWLGGLVPLGLILLGFAGPNAGAVSSVLDDVLMRFSGMGYAAVATLVVTGMVNSWFLVGSVSNLLGTTYGRILIAKLAFFAGMLALAAANRFWLMSAMETAKTADPNNRELWRRRLRTHVLGEQALGLLVLLSVSVLGTIRPALGQ
jgi:putative copper resistance protein D